MTTNIPKEKTIKIVTYNIFLYSDPVIIAQNILTMKKTGVDIFCLQEVLKMKGKPFVGDTIMKLLGDEWIIEYNLGAEDSDISHGVAILWNKRKFHKLAIKKIILPALIHLSFPNKLIRSIAGFKDIKIENKAISIDFLVGRRNLRVTSVHIGLSAGSSSHRLRQHQFLKKLLVSKTVPYEIIGGDFNTLRGITYKRELQSIQYIYGENFIEPSLEIPWTQDIHYSRFEKALVNYFIQYSKLHYRQKLDHIFTKGFTPLECERVNIEGSDHFPLVTTIYFPSR
jgi:endonuclease/exonuclease/phosphatase family metal-dependent hydrolase